MFFPEIIEKKLLLIYLLFKNPSKSSWVKVEIIDTIFIFIASFNGI